MLFCLSTAGIGAPLASVRLAEELTYHLGAGTKTRIAIEPIEVDHGARRRLVAERQSLRTKRPRWTSTVRPRRRPFLPKQGDGRTSATNLGSRTFPNRSLPKRRTLRPARRRQPERRNLAVRSPVSRQIQAALEAWSVRLVVSKQVLEALVFALILGIGEADPRNVGVGTRTRTRSVLAGALR